MSSSRSSAFGGEGFKHRTSSLREEIGRIWASCGVDTEYRRLRTVLLHRPGAELSSLADADSAQMLSLPDLDKAMRQHRAIENVYKSQGVKVYLLEPGETPPPNTMFQADLTFMTPEGALLARPASTVRAGEERYVARRLTELGIPIIRSIRGKGVFEGADAMWLNPDTVMVATGHRTNPEGREQVEAALREQGVEAVRVGLPQGSMHLMGTLRLPSDDLAVCWPGRVPYDAVRALRDRGYDVEYLPDLAEAAKGAPLNFVVIEPMKVLMPGSNPITREFYEDLGIGCLEVEIPEILKAAGGVACLTGVIEREMQSP
jgi:arginine deiminase